MTPLVFGIPANLFAIGVFCLGAVLILVLAAPLTRATAATQIIGVLTAGAAAIAVGNAESEVRLAVWAVAGATVIGLLLIEGLDLHDSGQRPEAAAILLLASGGGVALATGGDLLQMAIGLETLSLSIAVLVAMGRGEPVLEGAFKYFVLSTVNFATLIYGIGLVFLNTGSLALPTAATLRGGNGLVLAGVLLIGFGLTFKLAAVPNHWAGLDAYTSATPGIAGFVMAVSKLSVVVALGRLVLAIGAPLDTLLVGIGTLTIVWGTLGAFAQRELRRLLAYSTVVHGGFVALALGSGPQGPETAAFYALVYSAMALLVFAGLAGRGAGPIPLGQITAQPMGRLRLIALVLGLFSLSGIPPTPGFWAKLAVLWTAWHAVGPLPAVIAATGGAISVLYYLRPVPELIAQLRKDSPAPSATSPAIVLAGLAVVVLAVVPGAAWGLARLLGGA